MTVHHSDDHVTLHHGDARDVLALLPTASVDAIVTDPPYELGFMGKTWDSSGIAYDAAMWAECLRVLKPGGHLLAFGGTRTYHRMTVAIEDAGFEIRDSIHWIYSQGFPKSLNVSKAIDKRPGVARHAEFVAHLIERRTTAGLSRADVSERVVGTRSGACWNWEHHQFPEAKWWPSLRDLLDMDEAKWGPVIAEAERVRVGTRTTGIGTGRGAVAIMGDSENRDITAPATPEAAAWSGWGTALKPAHEPIVVARKPLAGTVAGNVLAHGTGALNIDGCRVEHGGNIEKHATPSRNGFTGGRSVEFGGFKADQGATSPTRYHDTGRWPANVIFDEAAAAELDAQSGVTASKAAVVAKPMQRQDNEVYGKGLGSIGPENTYSDTGGASRFFPVFRYEPKAPTAERPRVDGAAHATVKPLDLMRWLVRLVTPPGGTVLDPFAGSGTTAEACVVEGFRCVAIELDPDHLPLIKARLAKPIQPVLFGDEEAS